MDTVAEACYNGDSGMVCISNNVKGSSARKMVASAAEEWAESIYTAVLRGRWLWNNFEDHGGSGRSVNFNSNGTGTMLISEV